MPYHRPFATGSKPGPDAIDRFLETLGFYRKHTARDGTSLFRVVAEQVLSIQNYHDRVRQEAAGYLETHADEYANEVDKNLYSYVSNLRRTRTHGGLLELRVIARMYNRNVILFEPTQNQQVTQRWYVHDENNTEHTPLRIFYSHKDKHFDTIYTLPYVSLLAECQAIVYELLYVNVFKLPDVPYATERMLHDQAEETTVPLPDDPTKYQTVSGEIFEFSDHESTCCVLKDPKTCHFHNQDNFEEVVREYKDAITIINKPEESGRLKIFKPIDGFLHSKEKSCVRQLLDEKITPFPYKVAKALDPSMYRNTEFEIWADNRREQRSRWQDPIDMQMRGGGNGNDYWMCQDNNYQKTRRNSGNYSYYGMKKGCEQAMLSKSEYYALDEDLQKKYIIVDPNTDDYCNNYQNFQPARDFCDFVVMPTQINGNGNYKGNRFNPNFRQRFNQGSRGEGYNGNGRNGEGYNGNGRNGEGYNGNGRNGSGDRYQNYTGGYHNDRYQHQNHQQHQHQAVAMNYVGDIERVHQEQQQQYYQEPQQLSCQQQFASYDNGQHAAPIQLQHSMPQQFYQPIQSMVYEQQQIQFPDFSVPPPPLASQPPQTETAETNADTLHLIRREDLSLINIHYTPVESVAVDGSDLPTDTATLRFFYNLGARYYNVTGLNTRLDQVIHELEQLSVAPTTTETENSDARHEPPPPPTNTPVTHKPPGNRYQGPLSSKRPFNNPHHNNGNSQNGNNKPHQNGNRNGHGKNERNHHNNPLPRKDFQFNSNVKNVHKTESGAMAHSSSQHGAVQHAAVPVVHHTTPPKSENPVQSHEFSPISPVLHEVPTMFMQADPHMQHVQHIQQAPQTPYFQPQQAFLPPANIVYQTSDGVQFSQQPFVAQQAQYWPSHPSQAIYHQGTMYYNHSGVVSPQHVMGPPQPMLAPQQPPVMHQMIAPSTFANSTEQSIDSGIEYSYSFQQQQQQQQQQQPPQPYYVQVPQQQVYYAPAPHAPIPFENHIYQSTTLITENTSPVPPPQQQQKQETDTDNQDNQDKTIVSEQSIGEQETQTLEEESAAKVE